jgi:D-psicose/D-tagatose/L-ribulose 3-epimerase
VSTEEGIRYTKEIGFDAIDIQADPTDMDPKEKKLIRETIKNVGLNVISLTCVAPY